MFIAPGVVTSNDNFVGRTQERFKHFKGVTVKKGGRIGAGSVTLPGIVVGEDGLVAAGSVVTRDVPARKVVMGSARACVARRSGRAIARESGLGGLVSSAERKERTMGAMPTRPR